MDADGLPADFPRDEVPLLTGGEITSVQRDGKSGYAVTMVVDPDPADAVAQAMSLLEDAGWTSATDDRSDPVQVLRKDKGLVIITNTISNGQTVVNYALTLG